MQQQAKPIQLDYRSQRGRKRSRVLMAGIALLVGAWLLMGVGRHRVSSLDWSGYDPDPDISESLANDARCARAYLPFGISAVVMDVGAIIAAIAVCVHPKNRSLGVALLLVSFGSLCWHGFVSLAAAFFA